MAYGGAGAGGAAAAAAAIANAIKASGAIVNIEPQEFEKILRRAEHPVLVMAPGGVFKKHFKYLTSYKGLCFHTKSATTIPPGNAELITADKIWIPG